jgi:thioredoxin 1
MREIVSETDFQEVIITNKFVLVDFYATWCGPCKTLSQLLEQFSHENPNLLIVKVNVESHENLANDNDITALPTLKLFYKGAEVGRYEGSSKTHLDSIKNEINKHHH